MELEPHSFKTLHDFLDFIFKKRKSSPSDLEVFEMKKLFWRSKNTHRKREYRKNYAEFPVCFSSVELELLQANMGKERFVSRFVRQQILMMLHNDTIHKSVDTSVIEQQLFVIADYLQVILDLNQVVDEVRINKLECDIQGLQTLIEEIFDRKKQDI